MCTQLSLAVRGETIYLLKTDAGGVEALTRHLEHPSENLVLTCLRTLRNISNRPIPTTDALQLLQTCWKLLGSRNTQTVGMCVNIISNLSANNPENKASASHSLPMNSSSTFSPI